MARSDRVRSERPGRGRSPIRAPPPRPGWRKRLHAPAAARRCWKWLASASPGSHEGFEVAQYAGPVIEIVSASREGAGVLGADILPHDRRFLVDEWRPNQLGVEIPRPPRFRANVQDHKVLGKAGFDIVRKVSQVVEWVLAVAVGERVGQKANAREGLLKLATPSAGLEGGTVELVHAERCIERERVIAEPAFIRRERRVRLGKLIGLNE